jgi:NADP-dependent 3-hydroxy acid dehydrogenase YdfG
MSPTEIGHGPVKSARKDSDSMSSNIEGKVVVITGASSGLGEATARLLSEQGATVVLGARRVDRIEALAEELCDKGGRALAVQTDVTDREQVKALVDAAVAAYGRIDVMINNAGLMPHSPLERLKVDDWERTIDVNLKGVLWGIAAALPYMRPSRRPATSSTSPPWRATRSPRRAPSTRRPSMPCWRSPRACARR